MNKIPYVHYKKDKFDLLKLCYTCIFLFILFSIYKNGILLYQNGLIHFYSIFLPLYFYITSAIIGWIVATILKKDKKDYILLSLIISLTISINANMLFYPILLFVSLFIGTYLLDKTKMTFHLASFSRIILLLALFLQDYSYLNIGEKLGKFNYGLFDVFLGYGTGGLATTSLLLIIFCFFLLCQNRFYKKNIPIVATLSFLSLSGIYLLLFKDYEFLSQICNGTIYFSFVILAPISITTPIDKKGMGIYGLIIGVLSFCFLLIFNIYEAGIIAIFLSSIFIPFIDKVISQIYER